MIYENRETVFQTHFFVNRFRREVLLEELKGSTMTGESLGTIGRFLPRLEKIYLDDIFSDVTFLDLIKSRNDNIIEAWKKVAKSVLECALPMRKLRY